MRYKIITISGQLGSGKSTIAKLLAQKLNWQYYSTGMAQRTIAQKRGISTLELNKLAVQDPSIDKEIDSIFQNPPWGDSPCVVDSRLAFHFIPNSLKVRLIIEPEEAAKRVFQAKRSNENYASFAETKEALEKRTFLEKKHFIKNYQIDITDTKHFDLVINTTQLTIDEVCERVLNTLS